MAVRTQAPDGWQVARLGDVASLRNEQVTPVGGDPRPNVALENFVSGGSLNGYGKAGDSVSNKTTFRNGDTLYGKLRPNLRKVVRVDFEGVCSTDILAVFPNDPMDGLFLNHLLQGDPLHEHAMRGVAGTKMPRTSWKHLREYKFVCPPLPEQLTIAAVLDSIDEATERTEEVAAATERLRDSLLHRLLTRGVPGRHSEWKEAPGLGTIPACWDVVRLGDVTEVQTGRAVNRKADQTQGLEVPYLSVANVRDGYLDLGIVKNMLVPLDGIDRYRLRDGDVLFTEGDDADKLGRGTVWRDEIELCLHQNHVFAVRPRQGVLESDFLASFAASGFRKRYFLSAAKQTTNLASVNASQLKLMPMPLPTPQEQQARNRGTRRRG